MTVALRRKLWLKLAQTAAPATTPATTTAPTVSGNPTPVSVNSLPSRVVVGWGSENVNRIQRIVNALNQAIYAISAGQSDFNTFRQNYFASSATNVPDAVLLPIIRYSGWLYNRMLTPGGGTTVFQRPLTREQKSAIIKFLQSAMNQPLTKIPDGGLNPSLQAKIGGNLRDVIWDALLTIE